MKKKMLSIFLSFCLIFTSLFTLSGCDLLHDNDKRYYDEAVAKVGDDIITRNEVLTMFNYYYYTMGYYQYGYSTEVVYQMVIEALVKNKIMVIEAQSIEECAINDADDFYIWEQVFKNVYAQIDENEDKIRALFGVEEREVSEEEKDENLVTFEEYEKSKPNGEIKSAEICRTKAEWLQDLATSTDKATNYYRFLAYSRYISGLEKSADKYGKDEKTGAELLEQELNRLYEYYKESRYVEKYTAYMTNRITISEDEIQTEYQKALNKQLQEFTISGAFGDKIVNTSNTDLVVYRQNGNYYTVQHILLQFSDYNTDLKASEYLYNLDNYVSSYDSNQNLEQTFIDDFLKERENYAMNNEESLNMDYINPTTGKTNFDNDGNEVDYTLSDFDDMIFGIDGIYTKYESGEITYEELAKEFFQLKFSFSKDGGVTDLTSITNLMGYALPTSEAEGNSFVKEFADTCYDLYDQFTTDGSYGIQKVVTNFGVHYIMFTGVMGQGTLTLDDKFTLVSDQTVGEYFYENILKDKENSISADIGSVLYNQYYNNGLIEIFCETYEDCI